MFVITQEEYKDYLMHYGVLGMKWGVRKKEYGMSKRQLKRSVKQAKRAYRRISSDPWLFPGATGSNWHKVNNKHIQTIENDAKIREYTEKRNLNYKKADEAHDRGDWGSFERHIDAGDVYLQKRLDRSAEIGKTFEKQYDKALLKDINYSGSIETGMKMLADYNVHVYNKGFF